MPRDLVPLPVPAGPRSLTVLPALRAALDGSGPAVLPYDAGGIPPTFSAEHLAPCPDDLAVAIGTSGSTGAPKRALLTAGALSASAEATAARLGGHGDWLLALPAHHVAGLQVLLRAAAGGGTVHVLESGPFAAATFAAATTTLRTAGGGARPAYVSLVPTQLGRLLADPAGRVAAATYDAVLVGGAACPPELLHRAREAGVRVVTTYGSSETCGGCVYDGVPLACADLAVAENDAGDDAGDGATNGAGDTGEARAPLATSGQGRILIAGTMLAAGYLGDPERTAAAFVTRAGRRWFRTDDLGLLGPTPAGEGAHQPQAPRPHAHRPAADRTGPPAQLRVLGRVDDVIVTGGLKVAPRVVEDAVQPLLPDGWGAIAVGVPDVEWGEAVAVAIGPWPGQASTAEPPSAGRGSALPSPLGAGVDQLRSRLRGRLAPTALPRRLLVLDPLPTLGIGKPDRVEVRRAFAEAVLTE